MRDLGHPLVGGLLNAAPDAIIVTDEAGRMVLVNDQAERLFGYSRNELLGKAVEALVPEAKREAHVLRRIDYGRDHVPRTMDSRRELMARKKDGTTFPAEISLTAVETPAGMLVLAAVRDVTDRRHLAEEQTRLAAIIDSSRDAIISRTPEGIITSWNRGAERLFGYRATEVLGTTITDLMPQAERSRYEVQIAQVASGEQVGEQQVVRLRKDGGEITVSVAYSPIADAHGAVIGIASISRDVTERQRAEAMFRALIEAAPDAMVCIDSTGRITLLNAQVERLFRYRRRDELVGQLIDVLIPDFVHESLLPRPERSSEDSTRRRPVAGIQLTGRRSDGSEFPADINLSAFDSDDGPLVITAIRDLTERLELEAERERLKASEERERTERRLHQAQRMESLGQLAGGVAHDFNNLLAVILNYASFIKEEVVKGAEADLDRWSPVLKDLEQITNAATRATDLTHQLLAFGRREVARPELTDLNDVVREIEQLLRRTIGEDIDFVTSLGNDLWPVLVDRGQLDQVFLNLALNARAAMPHGGMLSVDTENVLVDDDYALQMNAGHLGPHVRVRFSDTGIGMNGETAARAFEPFFTTKPDGQGTGLGLATVYGILNQVGGDVQLYSIPGAGTTFHLLFPAQTSPAERVKSEVPSTSIARAAEGETILVVEDEAALREVTRRMLARNGFTVLLAENGHEAIALARRHLGGIDLLLTDVVLPSISGKELASTLRQVLPDLPVLFMSGYAQPVLASSGTLDAGVSLLEKPFMESLLIDKVREALQKGRAA